MSTSQRRKVDPNTPVTNPVLVDAIARYTISFGSVEQQLLDEELQKALFLMPVDMSAARITDNGSTGFKTMQVGSQFKIIHYQFPEKPPSLLLFTDWTSLRSWIKDDVSTIILDAEEAWEFAAEKYHGVVINPSGPYLFLDPEELERYRRPGRPA